MLADDPVGAGLGVWPDAHGFEQASRSGHRSGRFVCSSLRSGHRHFQQVDSILDPANPWQRTGYTYAGSNPTTLADHDGLHPVCGMDQADCGYDGEVWESHPNVAAFGNSVGRIKELLRILLGGHY